MGDDWRDLPGHESWYRVSRDGVVWSKIRGRALKPRATKNGHLIVHLSRPDRRVLVHVAVLESFVGPRPGGMVARHLNGVPDDNVLGNLKWGTVSENTMDAVRHGVHAQAAKICCPQGHPYDAENTRVLSDGSRECRVCRRETSRRNRAKPLSEDDPRHGTLTGYAHHCRCMRCGGANSTYQRGYRIKRGLQKASH